MKNRKLIEDSKEISIISKIKKKTITAIKKFKNSFRYLFLYEFLTMLQVGLCLLSIIIIFPVLLRIIWDISGIGLNVYNKITPNLFKSMTDLLKI